MQLEHKETVKISAVGKKVGVVTSRFNHEITQALLVVAKKQLAECGVASADCRFVSVPGAMEIPYALQKLARSEKYDCLVALGCVIRGDTPHFDYVCKMAQEGVLRVRLDHHIPIGFGVMTVNDMAQAKARLHIGGEAVLAALELSLI
jgi:6,7-dimethyl-8-ribityllumazine synthase